MDWRDRDYFWIGRRFLTNENIKNIKKIKSTKLHFSNKNHHPMRCYPALAEEHYNYPYPFICCVSVRKDYSDDLRNVLISVAEKDSECIWTEQIVLSRLVKDISSISILPEKSIITIYGRNCHFKINDYVYDEYGDGYLVHSFPFPRYTLEAMQKGLHKNTEVIVEGDFKGRFLQERIPLVKDTRYLARYMGF